MQTANTLIIELPYITRTIHLKRELTLTEIWDYLIRHRGNPLKLFVKNGTARVIY